MLEATGVLEATGADEEPTTGVEEGVDDGETTGELEVGDGSAGVEIAGIETGEVPTGTAVLGVGVGVGVTVVQD